MKQRLLLAAALLLGLTGANAQQVTQGESALFYYMPKTLLSLRVNVEKVEETAGPFYQYAERYLGTSDVVKESRTYYKMGSMHISQHAVRDDSRAYRLPLAGGLNATTDRNGVLTSVNQAKENAPSAGRHQADKRSDRKPAQAATLLPLGEEQMMAGSTAKMAESTAKQIYRIREARMNLISGDVDHMPADGESFKIMLQQLAQQEEQLTQLFTGKRVVSRSVQSVSLNVEADVTNAVLFRFSAYEGVVAADDLSGEPVYWTVRNEKKTYQPSAKAVQMPETGIYYNLPGQSTISVSREGKVLVSQTVEVAQFGISIPVDAKLIGRGAGITFNPATGNIVHIEAGSK